MEKNNIISRRVPPSDRWKLVEGDETIYPSLTDVLEAYFQKTQYKGDFILSPSEGVIRLVVEDEVKPDKNLTVKNYSLYNDNIKQGI